MVAKVTSSRLRKRLPGKVVTVLQPCCTPPFSFSFSAFSSGKKNKRGKERRNKSKCNHARKMQGLELELISFWGKKINSEGTRGSVKHNTKKALKIIVWMEKEPPGTWLLSTFNINSRAAREGKWIAQVAEQISSTAKAQNWPGHTQRSFHRP